MGTIVQVANGVALANLGLALFGLTVNPIPTPPAPPAAPGPLRPPNWGNRPQATILQVPSTVVGTAQLSGSGQSTTNFYFDAVFVVEHEQRLTPTKHPVQTGAAISDHAYLEPAEVTIEIGFSDVLQSFVPHQYTGNKSKSVSAYQTFIAIQAARQPLTLVTRLRTYTNMVITSLPSRDDAETLYGLKCRITFSQIIPAVVSITKYNTLAAQNVPQYLSARPQDSLTTNLGTKIPTSPAPTVTNNYNVLSPNSDELVANVPGAGNWSSNPISVSP